MLLPQIREQLDEDVYAQLACGEPPAAIERDQPRPVPPVGRPPGAGRREVAQRHCCAAAEPRGGPAPGAGQGDGGVGENSGGPIEEPGRGR